MNTTLENAKRLAEAAGYVAVSVRCGATRDSTATEPRDLADFNPPFTGPWQIDDNDGTATLAIDMGKGCIARWPLLREGEASPPCTPLAELQIVVSASAAE